MSVEEDDIDEQVGSAEEAIASIKGAFNTIRVETDHAIFAKFCCSNSLSVGIEEAAIAVLRG